LQYWRIIHHNEHHLKHDVSRQTPGFDRMNLLNERLTGMVCARFSVAQRLGPNDSTQHVKRGLALTCSSTSSSSSSSTAVARRITSLRWFACDMYVVRTYVASERQQGSHFSGQGRQAAIESLHHFKSRCCTIPTVRGTSECNHSHHPSSVQRGIG
jgi:hypothetical protein